MLPQNPQKPYPDFPLFAHGNGQWAKKINGKLRYFGPWADWKAALRKYRAEMDGPSNSLKVCIDRYIKWCELRQTSGDISLRHLRDIERTLAGLASIGPKKSIARLSSEDYAAWRAGLAKTNGPVAMSNHISRVRAFLNWCNREKIITEFPATDALKKPSRTQLRKARAEQGSKMFHAEEICRLLTHAQPQLRAMILLGINAGLGNNDVALLRIDHFNENMDWLNFPRNKTWIERKVPLWPETRAAIAAVIRPDDQIVFRTKYGNPWTPKSKARTGSPITQKFAKLCKDVDVYKFRRGFNSLRHTCQTIGEESGDLVAIDFILGHAPTANDMSAVYRERMSEKRLLRVVKHIYQWLNIPEELRTQLVIPMRAKKPKSPPILPPFESIDLPLESDQTIQ